MQDLNKTFGIIRSLLDTPHVNNWKLLCGYLDRYESTWNEPIVQERLLHYVRARLKLWPADLPRYAQHLWVTRALRGEEVPQMEFATAMQFVSQEAHEEAMTLLFSNHLILNMRTLDLRGTQPGYQGTLAFTENPWLDALRHIDLRRTGITGLMRRMICDRYKKQCQIVC